MITKLDNALELCDFKFSDDNSGEFEGYGSVFDSTDLGGDTIQKGAFVEAISKALPKMFINHNHGEIPVGDWTKAEENDIGLLMAGRVDLNHRDGPSVFSAMKRKAMSGLSIGALRSTLQFERKQDGGRLITKADLREVSIVTFPMEENAQIFAVKADIGLIENLKEAERFLRDAGHSKSFSNDLVSRIKDLARRDAEQFEDEITKQQIEQNTARIVNLFK